MDDVSHTRLIHSTLLLRSPSIHSTHNATPSYTYSIRPEVTAVLGGTSPKECQSLLGDTSTDTVPLSPSSPVTTHLQLLSLLRLQCINYHSPSLTTTKLLQLPHLLHYYSPKKLTLLHVQRPNPYNYYLRSPTTIGLLLLQKPTSYTYDRLQL